MVSITTHISVAEGPTNRQIARTLREVATWLQRRTDNPFRIAAYRAAAKTIERLGRPVSELVREVGVAGLRELPGIGDSLAHSLVELVETGHLDVLEQLQRDSRRDALLDSLPGVGRKLAGRIQQVLEIDTVDQLQAAAYDGRLRQVPGMGNKRIRAIRESLAVRLGRVPAKSRAFKAARGSGQPPVSELLDVDREYRQLAARHELPRVAPRQFNPTGAAWLPVLRTERTGRKYTALYSNTARAHQSGSLGDWVVIYRDGTRSAGQWTAITSRYGTLRGRRVIRGREAECREYYNGLAEQRMLRF